MLFHGWLGFLTEQIVDFSIVRQKDIFSNFNRNTLNKYNNIIQRYNIL